MRFLLVHALNRLPGIVGDFDRSSAVEFNAGLVDGFRANLGLFLQHRGA
jgi:hypothetical protein